MIPTTVPQENIGWKQHVRWVTPASLMGGGVLVLLWDTLGTTGVCFARMARGIYSLLRLLDDVFLDAGRYASWAQMEFSMIRPTPEKSTNRLRRGWVEIAVYGGLMCALWIGSDAAMNGIGPILFAGTLLFLVGVWDDKGHVPAWIRLTAQVVGGRSRHFDRHGLDALSRRTPWATGQYFDHTPVDRRYYERLQFL